MSISARSALGVWNFRSTFILAMIASAIGLGNLWRFSYLAAEHGGAPFVFSYLLALVFVAVPVLVAEVIIGSHGRSSPIISMNWAVKRAEANPAWKLVGWMATLTAVLMLSYYAVVAGWSLAYVGKMQSGMFSGASAAQIAADFSAFLSDPVEMVFWQSLFLGTVMVVVTLGVRMGLGLLFWMLFPCMVALLLVLIGFSLEHGDVEAAQSFLFGYDPWHFSANSVLAALGHAFFTLSVGLGAGMMFGAYAPERIPVVRTVMAVALLDTIFALAAGLAIFPIVFASNMQAAVGPGLMFISLPYAFGNMHDGEFFGSLFFVLVGLAALGTAVCLAEVSVSYLVQRFKLRRLYAVVLLTPLIWLLGVGSVLSFNQWSDGVGDTGMTFFELIERLSADILLPLIALLIAVFVGWVMRREAIRVEMYREDAEIFTLWRFSLRWIAPIAILAILAATVIGSL